jgi:hypothetical protein
MNATETKTARLATLARIALAAEAGAKRIQAYEQWSAAGGLAGYGRTGRPLYRRADGRRVISRMEALESYR